jgi:hypothetical protein
LLHFLFDDFSFQSYSGRAGTFYNKYPRIIGIPMLLLYGFATITGYFFALVVLLPIILPFYLLQKIFDYIFHREPDKKSIEISLLGFSDEKIFNLVHLLKNYYPELSIDDLKQKLYKLPLILNFDKETEADEYIENFKKNAVEYSIKTNKV